MYNISFKVEYLYNKFKKINIHIKIKGDDKIMKKINIETDQIRLDQFLKFIAVAQTGGHAKILIKNGEVKVNKKICLQRGKKLTQNDTIEIENEGAYIIVDK